MSIICVPFQLYHKQIFKNFTQTLFRPNYSYVAVVDELKAMNLKAVRSVTRKQCDETSEGFLVRIVLNPFQQGETLDKEILFGIIDLIL